MTSLECYSQLLYCIKHNNYKASEEDIIKILEIAEKELLIEGESILLSHAIGKWIAYCNDYRRRNVTVIPKRFLIRGSKSSIAMSPYDAWSFVTMLASYMENNVNKQEIRNWLPYIGGDFHSHEHKTKMVEHALMRIDISIVKCRQDLYKVWDERKERISQNEENKLTDVLSEARNILQQVNDQMHQVDEAVTQTNTKKAYTQLLELYNLIADIRDSEKRQKESYMTGNLEVLLDMITEYLAEYGISSIASSPGECFQGKIHEGRSNRCFDPRYAVVHKSLRTGFRWGEQVIQKERVIVEV